MKRYLLSCGAVALILANYCGAIKESSATPTQHEDAAPEAAEKKTDKKIEAITAQAYKTVDDARQMLELAKEKFKQLSSDPQTQKALDEIDKIFRLEYRVIELDKNNSVSQLETQLAELGNARWDCSTLHDTNSKTRLLCKRHPQSYLHYLKTLW